MAEWRTRTPLSDDEGPSSVPPEGNTRVSQTSLASQPPSSSERPRIEFRPSSAPPPSRDPGRRPSFTNLLAQPAKNRCKGHVFEGALGYLGERYGEEVVARTRGALPEAVREVLEAGVVLKGGWYPLDWYDALHAAAQIATGKGPELAREIGRETTRRDLASGIYKVFLKILWPELVIQKAPLIFNRYFEQGTLTVAQKDLEAPDLSGRHGAIASFSACVGFTANLWQDVIGGCEGGLLAAGAKDIVIEVTSGGRSGDTSCSGSASYR